MEGRANAEEERAEEWIDGKVGRQEGRRETRNGRIEMREKEERDRDCRREETGEERGGTIGERPYSRDWEHKEG